jgi:hypothetical protein
MFVHFYFSIVFMTGSIIFGSLVLTSTPPFVVDESARVKIGGVFIGLFMLIGPVVVFLLIIFFYVVVVLIAVH